MFTDDGIAREAGIHGAEWESAHGGYFADPHVAQPLIETVVRIARSSLPRVIVDLGGGTGYLLGQLMNNLANPALRFVNIDISPRQLDYDHHPRVCKVRCGLTEFQREMVEDQRKHCFFLMRSVLHYFGKDHLPEALVTLRGQLHAGEYFVHQSACFDEQHNADCLNQLYADMNSSKYYPIVSVMRDLLKKAGFSVESVQPAPALPLDAPELARRYQIDTANMSAIQARLTEQFGCIEHVFEPAADGFRAWLHYQIFVCRAADFTR